MMTGAMTLMRMESNEEEDDKGEEEEMKKRKSLWDTVDTSS